MNSVVAKVAEVRKALVAGAGALVALQAYGGWSTEVKDILATAVGVLGVFGITYLAKNDPPA